MNWDILMLFQFKCLKFIFFVKSSRIQGGEHAIRQIRFAWPKILLRQKLILQCYSAKAENVVYTNVSKSGNKN